VKKVSSVSACVGGTQGSCGKSVGVGRLAALGWGWEGKGRVEAKLR
jgi:hypothetical protein